MKLFLKKKFADRMHLVTRKELTTKLGYPRESLPPFAGGEYESDFVEVLRAKLAKRTSTIGKVTL